MSEVPTNLNTYSTALNNVIAASDGSTDELAAISYVILSGEGIDTIIESFSEENPEFAKALKNNKDSLKKPDVELSELGETDVEIPKELAEKLGLTGTQTTDGKIKISLHEFSHAASKECQKENDGSFLGQLDSLMVDIMCILLCQESKSKFINTLKEALSAKQAERGNLSKEFQAKTLEAVNEQVEADKAAAEAKKMSLFSAIANLILGIVIAVASIAFTAVTCGAGAGASATAIALAVASITASIVSAAASTASAACTIVSLTSENLDPATKEKLENAILGLGVVSAVFGLIGGGTEIACSVVSTTAKVGANVAVKAGTKIAQNATEEGIEQTLEAAGKAAAKAAEEVVQKATKEGVVDGSREAIEEAAKEAAKKVLQDSNKFTDDAIETIAETTAKTVAKRADWGDAVNFIDKLSSFVMLFSSVSQGATNIATGAMNIKAAEKQRELATFKIMIAILDKAIEALKDMINGLMQDIQKFVEDYLQNQEEAANALHDKSDAEQKIAQQPA